MEEHELRKEKIQEDYNDKYWELRYTVVQRHIPSFLQKMAGKVLSTGERRPAAPWAPASHAAAGAPHRAPRAPASPHGSWGPPSADPGCLGFHTTASAQSPRGHQLGDHPTELGSDT